MILDRKLLVSQGAQAVGVCRLRFGIAFLLLLCIGCLQEGRFEVVFDFPDDSYRQDPPLWVTARVEERPEAINRAGRVLTSVGPVLLRPSDLEVDSVPYGDNRVVVVEARESERPESQVLYYGISEAFSIYRNDEITVAVAVRATRPPHGNEVFLADPAGRRSTRPVNARSLELGIVADPTEVLQLSNSAGFAVEQITEMQVERLASVDAPSDGADHAEVRRVPWTLDQTCSTRQCDRVVYARFIDENGYASRAITAEITLDQRPPDQAEPPGAARGVAADTNLVVQIFADEPLDGPPPLTVVNHPDFILEAQSPGGHQAFIYRSQRPAGDLPIDTPLEVWADFQDLAGNIRPNIVVDRFFVSDGAEIRGLSAQPQILKLGDTLDIRFQLEADYPIQPASFLDPGQALVRIDDRPLHPEACQKVAGAGAVDYRCQFQLTERTVPADLNPRTKALVVEVRSKDAVGLESAVSTSVLADYAPPQVRSAGFSPRFAGPGQDVRITLNTSEPLVGAPALVFAPRDPGFELQRSAELSYTYRLAANHGALDGEYTLRGVRATDAAGNVHTSTIGEAFHLDTAAPTLSGLIIGRTEGDHFISQRRFRPPSGLELCFDVDEPVAVEGRLILDHRPPQALACEHRPKACGEERPRQSCRLALDSHLVPHGHESRATIALRVRDQSGNLGQQDLSIDLDHRPPGLRFARWTSLSRYTKVNDQIRFEVGFDEPLKAGSQPDLQIRDAAGRALGLVLEESLRPDSEPTFRYVATIEESRPPGRWQRFVVERIGATDRLQNRAEHIPNPELWLVVDRQPPTISGLQIVGASGASGTVGAARSRVRSAESLAVVFTTSEPVTEAEVRFDGERIEDCTPVATRSGQQDWQCVFTTGQYDEQERIAFIQVQVQDPSRNIGEAQRHVVIDERPPTATAEWSAATARAGSVVKLTVRASEPLALVPALTLVGPELVLAPADAGRPSTTFVFTATVTPQTGSGTVALSALGLVDVFENSTGMFTVTPPASIWVDPQAPVIEDFVAPENLGLNGRMNVSFEVVDNDQAHTIALLFRGRDYFPGCLRSEGHYECDVSIVSEGGGLPRIEAVEALALSVRDRAGNLVSQQRMVSIDTLAPEIFGVVLSDRHLRPNQGVRLDIVTSEAASVIGLQWSDASPDAPGAFVHPDFSGSGLALQFVASAEDRCYRLEGMTLRDLRGNETIADVQAIADTWFCVDATPPVVELSLETSDGAPLETIGPGSRVQFRLRRLADPTPLPLVSDDARIDLHFGEVEILAGRGLEVGQEILETYEIPEDFVLEGRVETVLATAWAWDAVDNLETLNAFVTGDFRAPELVSTTLSISPPAGSLAEVYGLAVTAISAAPRGPRSEVELRFTADEPILAPTLRLVDALGEEAASGFFEADPAEGLASSFVFRGTHPAVGDGPGSSAAFRFEAELVDAVGNKENVVLAAYDVDSVAPGSLRRDFVRHERIPWGRESTAGLPQSKLLFEPGALGVDSGTSRRLLVFATEPAQVGAALLVNHAVEVGLTEVELPARRDYPEVFAAVIDAAGNETPLGNIYRGRFVATMNESEETPSNPNRVVTTPALRDALVQDPERSEILSTFERQKLGRREDGEAWSGVVVSGTRSWVEVSESYVAGEPPPRSYPAYTYDAKNGRLLLFGGRLLQTKQLTRETWEWDGRKQRRLTVAGGAPSEREKAALAYCRDGSFVLFGGQIEGGSPSAELWRLDGEVWSPVEAPEGSAWPPARSMQTMTYVNGLTLMYGGLGFLDPLNDLWAWDGERWFELSADVAADGGPTGRLGHGAVFDRYRGRMVVAGGLEALEGGGPGTRTSTETWVFTPPTLEQLRDPDSAEWGEDQTPGDIRGTWVRLPGPDLPAMGETELAIDRPSGRIYALGAAGADDPEARMQLYRTRATAVDSLLSDSDSGWERVTTPGGQPFARKGSILGYQIETNQIMIYGGEGAKTIPDLVPLPHSNLGGTGGGQPPSESPALDVESGAEDWQVDSAFTEFRYTLYYDDYDFIRTQPGVWPTSRIGHRLAYDHARQDTLLVGGADRDDPLAQPGTAFYWNGLSWDDSVDYDAALIGPSVASGWIRENGDWRPAGLVFGGIPELQNAQKWLGWNRAAVLEPSPIRLSERQGGQMVYLDNEGLWIMFGGQESGTFLRETHTSEDTLNWWSLFGPAPSPRIGHAMAYDAERRQIVLFGGFDHLNELKNDTWVYSEFTWEQKEPESVPPVRRDHALVYDRERKRVVLIGGRIAQGRPVPDSWEWNGTNWQRLEAGDLPGPADGNAASYDERRQKVVAVHGRFGRSVWELETGLSRVPAAVMSIDLSSARIKREWIDGLTIDEHVSRGVSSGKASLLPLLNLGRHGVIAPILARKGLRPRSGPDVYVPFVPVLPDGPSSLNPRPQRSESTALRLWNDALQSWTKAPAEISHFEGGLLGEPRDFVTPDGWLHLVARPTREAEGLIAEDPMVDVNYIEAALEYEMPERSTTVDEL